MHNEIFPIDKTTLEPYFEQWSSKRLKIEVAYLEKSPEAIGMMRVALQLFDELLNSVSTTVDARSGKTISILLPLNGTERLQFVKDKIESHYAFVQLDALYLETKKKVARLSIITKKTEA